MIPSNPLPNDNNCGTTNPNGYAYKPIVVNNVAASYTLSFCLGGTTGSYSSGPHTLTQAGIQ
jgi:hypothetical protein